eukprot:TRINITY_DN10441_c0_g1_i1.p1 TRINITY_DN10441_c0_g1~~TRINITY_DN10441_c0_g1_i1.p1  ORF type:complete len:452 (-),score=53.35 TRINITY_DN10441_c0_g1_i1:50-1405(-)
MNKVVPLESLYPQTKDFVTSKSTDNLIADDDITKDGSEEECISITSITKFCVFILAASLFPCLIYLIPLQPPLPYFYPGQLVFLIPWNLFTVLLMTPIGVFATYTSIGIFEVKFQKAFLFCPLVVFVPSLLVSLISMLCNAFPLPFHGMITTFPFSAYLVCVYLTFPERLRMNPIFRKEFFAYFNYGTIFHLGWVVWCVVYVIAFYAAGVGSISYIINLAFQLIHSLYKSVDRFFFTKSLEACTTCPVTKEKGEELLLGAAWYYEIVTQLFLSGLFPLYQSWGVFFGFLIAETMLTSFQLYFTTAEISKKLAKNRWASFILINNLSHKTKLNNFFLNCLARVMSSLSVIVSAPILKYGHNAPYFNYYNLTDSQLQQVIYFALISIFVAIFNMWVGHYIFKSKGDNLLLEGRQYVKQWKSMILSNMWSAYVFPLVVLTRHNNVQYWITNQFS